MKQMKFLLLSVVMVLGIEAAEAKRPAPPPPPPPVSLTATFDNAQVYYGVDSFTGIDDLTGLQADARATQDARGVWNVWTSYTEHLVVANNNDLLNPGGVTFSLPGRTFDLTGFTMFGYVLGNPSAAGKRLDYSILAYYPNNPNPTVVTFSINSLAVLSRDFSTDLRLKGLDHAVVQFAPNVGKTYFINTVFTPY